MGKGVHVLLVGAEDEENLAIRSLGAFLAQHGTAVSIAPFGGPHDADGVLKRVRRLRPNILAASVAFQCKANDFFAMLQQVRAEGFRGHIVIGGHFPTFEYRRILETQPAIDSVIRYEGEHGIVPLTRAVAGAAEFQDVPNLVYRTEQGLAENPCVHQFMDLDALPFPLRGRVAQRRLGEPFATLISSRGCWHSSCLYCCIGAFHHEKTERFALRTAASVAEEIASLHRRKGVRLFQFHDDNFVLSSPQQTCCRIDDIRREVQSRGVDIAEVAFLIKARPDVVDESVAVALKNMGCVGVFLGVENATESGLHALCRGAGAAGVERAIDCLRRQDQAITYNLLMFHPHATIDELRANLEFVRRRPDMPFDFGRAEIVAGSPLERLTVRENLRCGEWPMWDYRLCDEAVQRAFDIYRSTFRAAHTGYSSTMHEMIALCYHAAVLCRLHAGASAAAIAKAVAELITRANIFVIDRAGEMISMAEKEAPASAADDFSLSLRAGCVDFLRQADRLRQEMLRLQAAEHVFDWFGIRSMVQESGLSGLFGVRKAAAT